ncbi:hypothetical protein ACFS4T_25775 [Pseudomonas lini]
MWLRQGRSAWWIIPALLSLILFAVLLTRVEASYAGRAYAAYGGHLHHCVDWLAGGGRADSSTGLGLDWCGAVCDRRHGHLVRPASLRFLKDRSFIQPVCRMGPSGRSILRCRARLFCCRCIEHPLRAGHLQGPETLKDECHACTQSRCGRVDFHW